MQVKSPFTHQIRKFISFALFVALVVSGLFLTDSSQSAKTNTKGSAEHSAWQFPNLTDAEATEYLERHGLYDSLRNVVETARYRVSPSENESHSLPGYSYEAINPGQRFTTYFSKNNIRLVSSGGDWHLNVSLEQIGRGNELAEIKAGRMTVRSKKNGFEIKKSAANSKITEWYENSPRGLEQGWDIASRPLVQNGGQILNLMLSVNGDLKPQLAKSGREISFVDNKGVSILKYNHLKSWDATGRSLPSQMDVVDGNIAILVDDRDAVYPVTIDPFFVQSRKLGASDAAANDEFGSSIAISGSTAVVGARGDGAQTGSAYIFERNAGGQDNWGEIRKISAADGATGDNFGHAVSISGDTVIVGAYGNDDAGLTSGSAYIFERNTGGPDMWGEVRKLTASDAAGNDNFGWTVSISSDVAIVGAYGNDDAGSQSGSAYLFERNVGGVNNWGERKKLTASDAALADNFGWSVAISKDTAIVGAINDDDMAGDTGSVYIYTRNQGGLENWGEVKKINSADAAGGDEFGYALAIDGDLLIATTVNDDDNGADSGSAYIFERNQGGADNWGQVKKLTASDGAVSDLFGYSVAISVDTVVIGAQQDDDTFLGSGSAYVFERNTGGGDNWGQVQKLVAADPGTSDQFGQSVGIAGKTVITGANKDDDGGGTSGSAYVFKDINMNWGQVVRSLASDGETDDFYGHAVAISGDTAVVGASDNDGANGPRSGSAYIIERNHAGPNGWGLVKKIESSDGVALDNFGYSVSISGDTAIVGAPFNDTATNDGGAAYIFERNTGGVNNWGEVQKLASSDVADRDLFGVTVSISGDTAVVGAPHNADAGNFSGSAYVFERNTGGSNNWGEVKKLLSSDLADSDLFGISVGVSDDTIIVGAQSNDDGQINAGSAYIFERNVGGAENWGEVQKLTPSDPSQFLAMGTSVAISGDTAVSCGPGNSLTEGGAYVFERNNGGMNNWGEVKKLAGSGAASFGISVSISVDTVVVGARFDDEGGINSGAAFVFERNFGGMDNWGKVRKLIPIESAAQDRLGTSVGISHDTVIAGAPEVDIAPLRGLERNNKRSSVLDTKNMSVLADDQGAAYIFNIVPGTGTATVAGRVTTSSGQGIPRTIVSLTDLDGNVRIISTNPFGYFRFTNVDAGEAYFVSVAHKTYSFTPDTQAVAVNNDVGGVNFTGFAN